MIVGIRRNIRQFAYATVVILAFGIGNITGWFVRPVWAAEAPPEFALFWEAWDIVLTNFVDQDKLDFQRMTYGAIQGMLATLGDTNHTAFFDPETAKLQQDALEGSFEGIGAHVTTENGQFTIVAPIRGSPAEAAGILAGDVVLAIDGTPIADIPEWEVIQRVRGPVGTPVVLTILHPEAEEPVDIMVIRGRIELDSVVWTRIPGTEIAYLQITQFAGDTNFELMRALRAIRAEAAHGRAVRGIVLDLRNNPGGYLHEAIRVGAQFLPSGQVILHERDAKGVITTHKSVGNGLAREFPLVVLVNQGSASAAEILAGALQENERAQLVGATTLGTGTVLQPFTLSDGSVLRLGVTNWLTPQMHLIKDQGIQPTIQVTQPAVAALLDAAALDEMTAEQLWQTADRQFDAALLLIRLLSLDEK
ncbi:MAG: S41 family peptidase [Caldilineaceae bacterium]|nr:S41 family peptidase [Caldilineaceae bacterium]